MTAGVALEKDRHSRNVIGQSRGTRALSQQAHLTTTLMDSIII